MPAIRNVTANDGAIMRKLAHECGTLDLHTPYTYWVNACYQSESCFVAEEDGKPIGYIMAVDAPDVVFIWQIGIVPEWRGKGLADRLITKCVDYATKKNKNIEVTIAADNRASYRAFKKACDKRNIAMQHIGSVDIADMIDPAFTEKENRYMLQIKSEPD